MSEKNACYTNVKLRLKLFGMFVVIVFIYHFNISVVRGRSMSPTVQDGDRILINRLSYFFYEIERGDIIVFKYPLDKNVKYIKRVIGVPGDTVVLNEGEVWINGEKLNEAYLDAPDLTDHSMAIVKPAHYFVLGDFRKKSSDSRGFGQVPQEYIGGKVNVIVWPPMHFRMIN